MAKRFSDQVVWITGAGSGIGRSCALEMARRGADVALSGRRLERLEAVADEIEALGRRALPVPCDVTEDEQIESAVRHVLDAFGRMDVALANAGFGVGGRVEELTAADWRRQLNVNVVGAAMTARYALPALRNSRGRIGLIGSVAGYVAAPYYAPYHASKFALRALGRTLSLELRGSGVSCTAIHPGFVASEINQVDNQGRFDASREDKRPKLLMWSSERAAVAVADALYRRKREVVITGHGKVMAWLGIHFPDVAYFVMTRDAMRRQSDGIRVE